MPTLMKLKITYGLDLVAKVEMTLYIRGQISPAAVVMGGQEDKIIKVYDSTSLYHNHCNYLCTFVFFSCSY